MYLMSLNIYLRMIKMVTVLRILYHDISKGSSDKRHTRMTAVPAGRQGGTMVKGGGGSNPSCPTLLSA